MQPHKGAEFHRGGEVNIVTRVGKLEHAPQSFVLRVFVAACGDDMVGCVPQLVAHETPR